ncbi:MAG: NAD(P)/FAD-dependent oxidoreductase [Gemmatimonadota bacterium]|nr:NAD(P)/FAD-dependent oxidoreductase [Gemmatimonadota bacterium]
MTSQQKPHVVILGGGFGGMRAARGLRHAPVRVTLIDRANHHVFQPLLYQVATAALAPSDIASPIRWMLRKQRNATVLLDEVRGVDADRHIVRLDGGRQISYDYLVVATGARHSYFGHGEWEEIAPGLKSLEDALEIRRRFLLAFELAEKSQDAEEQRALQTFVLVGGGPTGVELAGVMPSIAHDAMRRDFRRIDTQNTRVVLLEGGPRVLPSFPESLSRRAHKDLEDLGVEVRTNALVTRVESDAVWMGDERIATRTVFWAAGNAASPIGQSLGSHHDRAGRVQVSPDLSVPERPNVFVIGDLAIVTQDGKPVPAVAPAAMQMGDAAAKNIRRDLRDEPRVSFRYRNKGDLATIGRHKAIADFGKFHVTGRLALWFWLFVHIMYLVGFRNRLSVLLQWAYAYVTYQRGVRLIMHASRLC